MSSDQEQLVQAITEHVLAALRDHTGEQRDRMSSGNSAAGQGRDDRRGNASVSPDASQPHAAIRPPIGVCTGDYSQFPELRRRPATPGSPAVPRNGAGAQQAASAATASQSESAPTTDATDSTPALTGIVTARQLEEVAGRTSGRVIQLSPDARLSPLAADRVRDRGLHIQRTNTPNGTATPPRQSADTWLWWIDGQCPAVRQITEAMNPTLRPLTRRRESSALAETITEMAQQVRRGEAAGGILFVPSSARAGCFANRCKPLRAVVGTCEQAVTEGIEYLGANVLIVEYPHQAPETMHRMVERFVCAPRSGNAAVDRQLRELSRCV